MFAAHPSLGLVAADYPGDKIWQAVLQEDEAAMQGIDLGAGPVWLLVERIASGVEVARLAEADWRFRGELCAARPLGDAIDAVPEIDPAGLLAGHLAAGRFISFAYGLASIRQLIEISQAVRQEPIMSTTRKLAAGEATPTIAAPKVGGSEIAIGNSGGWQMAVVYRGKHCPICRIYLKGLDALCDAFRAGSTEIVAVSGDPQDKAESEGAEEGWRFPVGYGLTTGQMRQLGLYISEPRSPQETDRPFPDPGLFVINPQGLAHIVDISNAPFALPDRKGVLNGLKLIKERGYPIRGTAA
jgi:peroxiredoxin